MPKLLTIVLGNILILTVFFVHDTECKEMVVYWGQDWQNPLELQTFCQHTNYDTVVLAFLQNFFDNRNKDLLPSLSFSAGCNTTVGPQYPNLLRCYGIEEGIKICQSRSKKVLLSLGGFLGNYSFESNSQAQTFANTIWNMFLNGQSNPEVRPFGSAVLDGIDLDVEKGTPLGYAAFVKRLSDLMKSDSTKQYQLTAPPGCPYPDLYLGPNTTANTDTAFTLHGELFTNLYIQFYCCTCVPGNDIFWYRFEKWNEFAKHVAGNHSGVGPKVYIGLAAHPRASGIPGGEVYYRSLADIKAVYERAKTFSTFGGFMLWNAGYNDLSKMSDGRPYGDHIRDILFEIEDTDKVSMAVIIIAIVVLVIFVGLGAVAYWKTSASIPKKTALR